ncbi:MAG: DUF899 domain-containing protein [Rhodobacteraceae bacterium]|jgi:predicted dithiol-disulfide oxidoreductase (DUF899 family)|nr:DUF899 domain-containing protein [Paracoccaceae bacterium]MBL4558828.1 DUF899 domain-containing protein [Paracoccaceae bacterium]HBG99380.1 DUF899 domain-containing protein [Paracoccaceae bacterium]
MPRPAVTRAEWLSARMELLEKEKALTRARDDLAAARRALPRVAVSADCSFTGPDGPESLSDLFGPHSQLVVYHFMYGPDLTAGCVNCSFWMDSLDGTAPHLAARDVALVLVSAAPYPQLAAYRARMGWQLRWVSSAGSSFNRDMGVQFTAEEVASGTATYNYRASGFPSTEAPGLSVFQKDPDGTIHHTYSAFGRGLDGLNAAYQMLDLVPKGRDEAALPYPMAWVRRHDAYDAPA